MIEGNAGVVCKTPGKDSAQLHKVRPSSLCVRYTVLFCVCAFFSFLPYLILGRSFVYRIDGASQYVVYLRYMGQYLREWIRNIFHGDFVPVMYDFSIGMGDDINSIIRFHPLDFLSVLVPSSYTEYLYAFILLLRYYLAGLSFCAFASCWKDAPANGPDSLPFRVSDINILSGSMIYVFCGYMLMRCMNHPTYVSAFIIFPMLLLAAEKVMAKKGAWLLSLVVFLGFVSNYYFMYISSFGLLVYVLFRMPDVISRQCAARQMAKPEGNGRTRAGGSALSCRLRCFSLHFVRFVFYYLLGMGMSLITLLPTLTRYLNSFRTQQITTRQNLFFYQDIRRYFAWLITLITPYVSSGNGTNLNYAVTIFPALICLFFFCRGKLRTLKGVLVVELICLLVPACGYVMAGFNNENNRWMYLIAMALGMTVAFVTDYLADMDLKRRKYLVLSGIAFAILAAATGFNIDKSIYTAAAVAELAVCILVILFMNRKEAGVGAVRKAVLVLTCLSVIINAWFTFMPGLGNMAAQCTKAGNAYKLYKKGIGHSAYQMSMDKIERTDTSAMAAGAENSGIYYGYYGTSMYNSIVNADLLKTLIDEDNIGLDSITHLYDLDGRIVTDSLAGVKYYVTKTKGNQPYGFTDEPVLKDGKYYVYENEYALPFAYSYDSCISLSDYDRLDSVRKEFVKLYAAVVPDNCLPSDPGDTEKSSEPEIAEVLSDSENGEAAGKRKRITDVPGDIITVPLEPIEENSGVEKTEDGYRVKAKTEVIYSYENKPGYLCLLKINDLNCGYRRQYVKATTGKTSKKFFIRNEKDTYTLLRKDYLVSLMTQTAAQNQGGYDGLALRFGPGNDYSFKSVEMIYVPAADFRTQIGKLSEESMQNISSTKNRITGNLALSEEKIVCFRVLNQKGWHLFVDGQETELFCANNCYTGALIPEGDHEIVLEYETPGLRPGAVISLGSFLLWILLLVLGFRKKRDPGIS